MTWELKYLPEALDDLKQLDKSQAILVQKAIKKVLQNPLPNSENGYGKPLGNKNGNNLSNLLKIKLRNSGLRIVYKIERTEKEMVVIIIGARADSEAYRIAALRAKELS